MYTRADIEELAEDFENCRKVLIALGDENRQHLILEMMKMEDCYGARDPDAKSFDRLIHMLQRAKELMAGLPDRD